MSAREKIAYLRGLIEGQNVSENAGLSKFHEALLGALDALAAEVERVSEEQSDLREYVEQIDEDLIELQSELEELDEDDFDERSAYDDEDDEDGGEEEEYEAVCCPACGKDFFYQPAAYDDDEDLLCPHCGEPFVKG